MKKSAALAALAAAFCLTSCGAKKVSFSELGKTCDEVNRKATDPRVAIGPEVTLEGYLTEAGEGYSSDALIKISEAKSDGAETVSVQVAKGTRPNQVEITGAGDKVSGFRLHTDDGGVAVAGDKVSITLDVTGVPLNRDCIYQGKKISKN